VLLHSEGGPSLRRFSLIYNVLFVFAFCLVVACSAQNSSAPAPLASELAHRIELEVRSRYQVPPGVNVAIGTPSASEITGYDNVTVTLSGGTHSSTHEFLISKDHKTLAHMEKMDLTQDLMSKIDTKGRPWRGSPNAKVTIVNFDDFECPFCSRMHATLFPGLLKAYGDKVRIIYKDFPLVEIHPWAMHAAIDGNCLAAQNNDAYWEFADYVHSNQQTFPGRSPDEAKAKLDATTLERGTKFKLDQAKLDACVKKQDESAVRASMAEGDKMAVDSTPTMFVNGERMSGAIPEAEMRQVLDRALVAAGDKAPQSDAKK
jgi:protein-disulfide isomerase